MSYFAYTIILWCWRRYGSTPLSYTNVGDILVESGISVHRLTIYRWFIEYAPILRQKLKKILIHSGYFLLAARWNLRQSERKMILPLPCDR